MSKTTLDDRLRALDDALAGMLAQCSCCTLDDTKWFHDALHAAAAIGAEDAAAEGRRLANEQYQCGWDDGKAEAYEDAARVVEHAMNRPPAWSNNDLAHAIRARAAAKVGK